MAHRVVVSIATEPLAIPDALEKRVLPPVIRRLATGAGRRLRGIRLVAFLHALDLVWCKHVNSMCLRILSRVRIPGKPGHRNPRLLRRCRLRCRASLLFHLSLGYFHPLSRIFVCSGCSFCTSLCSALTVLGIGAVRPTVGSGTRGTGPNIHNHQRTSVCHMSYSVTPPPYCRS